MSFERRLDDESRAADYTAKENKYQHRQRNSFFEKRPLGKESADNELRAQRCHRSAFNAPLAKSKKTYSNRTASKMKVPGAN